MGIAAAPSPKRTLLVADSFRVRDHGGVAEVRGLSHHLARFRASVLASENSVTPCPLTTSEVDSFIASALPRIAAAGEGFPRLELWRENVARQTSKTPESSLSLSLSLAIRPLPELREAITLTSVARPNGLADAKVKGPNIASYSALSRQLGGEALLLDETGRVVEGTTTSLIWWNADGSGAYSAVPDRVSSVTELLVREIALRFGTELRPEQRSPADLTKFEVWAVNALHGIRPVLSIDGRASARHDPDRLDQYRVALDAAWEPVRA